MASPNPLSVAAPDAEAFVILALPYMRLEEVKVRYALIEDKVVINSIAWRDCDLAGAFDDAEMAELARQVWSEING